MERATHSEGKEAAAERHAKTLHDGWGVGHGECSDGITLFASIADRQMYISTGAGINGVLTDAHLEAVIERMRPLLRKGLHDAAMLQAASDISDVLFESALAADGSPHPRSRGQPSAVSRAVVKSAERARKDKWALAAFGCFFVVVLSAVIVLSIKSHQRYQQRLSAWEAARTRLQEIERLARAAPPPPATRAGADAGEDPIGAAPPSTAAPAAAAPLAARMTCCPICLEDFAPEGAAGAGEAPPAATIVLPCQHRFHDDCIHGWLGGQRRRDCPVCRTPAYHEDGRLLTSEEVVEAQQPRQRRRDRDVGRDDGGDAAAAAAVQPAGTGGGGDGGGGAPRAGGGGGSCCGACSRGRPFNGPRGRYYHHRTYYYPTTMYDAGFSDGVRAAAAADADVAFLLSSLHHRYPEAVTAEQVRVWTADPTRMATPSFSSDTTFVARKPAPPSSSSSSGGSSRSSFGGGRSSGGGGRGGGW